MREIMAHLNRIDRTLWLPNALEQRAIAIFRFTLSLIFIVGGLGHFVQLQEMLDRMAESPWQEQIEMIGDPSMLLWLSGAAFIFFGLLLMLGVMQRLSALVLFITLVPITLSIHIAPGHVGPLLKNVAILGGLVLVYANGTRPK